MDAGGFLKLAQSRSAQILLSDQLKLPTIAENFCVGRKVPFKQLLEQAPYLGPFDVILISSAEFQSYREQILRFSCLIGVQTDDPQLASLADFIFVELRLNSQIVVEKPLCTQKACFLDRDGVLIEDGHYLSDPKQVKLRMSLVPTIKKLQSEGYLLIVVTNQSGIGRGYFTESQFHQVNNQMKRLLLEEGIWLDDVFWSPFYDGCASGSGILGKSLRKPRCGMIKLACEKYAIAAKDSLLFGDHATDLIAGAHYEVGKNFLVGSSICDREWSELLQHFNQSGSDLPEEHFAINQVQFVKNKEL